jgi:sporulation protein YlmC with PRC-barrel domain
MSTRISRLYGMDIYTDGGRFLGKVQDMIIDLEKGEVVRVAMEPLGSVSREEARRILREGSILYKNVKSVEDVVVVAKGGTGNSPPIDDFSGRDSIGFSRR